MIGIEDIGIYIAESVQDNLSKSYDGTPVDAEFVKNKIGFLSTARRQENENTADLCEKAFLDLKKRVQGLSDEDVECICVCTQNGEYQLPHTSAILQDRLMLSGHCAAFDISLGCSGYVYGLDILASFMSAHGYGNGLFFTCDPYSKVLDTNDRNTDLLFGDAATVTLLSRQQGRFFVKGAVYGTKGKDYKALIKEKDKPLYMNGRKVYNFVLREGAETIRRCMEENGRVDEDIDLYEFHQASKYVMENLIRQLGIAKEKVPFHAQSYGNTVSSSIPLLLREYLEEEQIRTILLSGFGVGLSASAAIIERA